MTKLRVAFRNFANASKTLIVPLFSIYYQSTWTK